MFGPVAMLPPCMGTRLQVFLFLLVSCFQMYGVCSETSQRLLGRRIDRRSLDSCRSVADDFSGMNWDEKISIPSRKLSDQNLGICNETANGTCCTRSMEAKLLRFAVDQTHEVVTNQSLELRSHLASSAKMYRDHFSEVLSLSENNTREMLTSTFKFSMKSTNSSVVRLFTDFSAHIHQQGQTNVKQSVHQFFEALFPLIFTFTLNDPSPVTDEYLECLTNNWKNLTPPPFGEVGRKLVQDVARSLEVTRALLDAFDLMAETINVTNQFGSEDYCSQPLTRLLFCSKCEGYSDVPPCKNFCLNVVRGCMAHVTEVNLHWNLFVSAVEKLITSLRGTYDPQDVLNSFHSKVYEGIMHYLDNAGNYHELVTSKCGNPFVSLTTGSTSARKESDVTNSESSLSSESSRMMDSSRPLLEVFPMKSHKKFSFGVVIQNVALSKNFFGKLPDSVCSSQKFAVTTNNSCWNGASVSRYSRPVTGMSLTTQVAENPEVLVPAALVPELVQIIERLNQMTKALHSRVIPRPLPVQNYPSYMYSGGGSDLDIPSGSGWYTDDDEGYSGSGSGTTFSPGTMGGDQKITTGEVTSTDTTDFDFPPSTSSQPPPYSTSTTSTTTSSAPEEHDIPSTRVAKTTTTTTRRPAVPPISRGIVTSAGVFLPVLAVAIQRLHSAQVSSTY